MVTQVFNFLENIALSSDTQETDTEEGPSFFDDFTPFQRFGIPVVHLVGLSENLFPSVMSSNSREELEEERRLFYGAYPKENKVVLSYATSRFQWGKNTLF